ncbi:MAG: hypothetical protein QHH75_11175 [Bacillota bacterium]|nr:hypothetical protein [Bacillota bacterium]
MGRKDEDAAKKLEKRLSNLEKILSELKQMLAEKPWTIDRVIIEKMNTEKIEFNIDTIDVKEQSGVLNIGLNYGGRLVKIGSGDGGKSQSGNRFPGVKKPAGKKTAGPKLNFVFKK